MRVHHKWSLLVFYIKQFENYDCLNKRHANFLTLSTSKARNIHTYSSKFMEVSFRGRLNYEVVTVSSRLAVQPSSLYNSIRGEARWQPPIFVSCPLIRLTKIDLVTIFDCDYRWYCTIDYVIVNYIGIPHLFHHIQGIETEFTMVLGPKLKSKIFNCFETIYLQACL